MKWISKIVKKNDITSLDGNTCIKLTLNCADYHLDSKQNSTIKTLPKVSFDSESDLILMSLIKDRVFQLYKKHILMSDLLKRTKEKLLNKDFIDSTVEILNIEPLVNGLMDTISEHSKWGITKTVLNTNILYS